MIETTYVRLAQAAEMLNTDADTVLLAAAEGRLKLYVLIPEWREAHLLLNDYDNWEGRVTIGRTSLFVGFAPLHQSQAARMLIHGEANVRVFTDDRPLSEKSIQELKGKYDRSEWLAYWAFAPDGPEDTPPVAHRNAVYLKSETVNSIVKRGETPNPTDFPERRAQFDHSYVSEGLALLNQASRKMWANASRNDPSTHPSNAQVAAWLAEHGLSKSQADRAASIIRPEWAHTGRKPDT